MGELVTTPWDPADHLAAEEDRAAYLETALEKGDPALVAAAPSPDATLRAAPAPPWPASGTGSWA